MIRRLLAPILIAVALVFATAGPASASTYYTVVGKCSGYSYVDYKGGGGRPHVAWSLTGSGCTYVRARVIFSSRPAVDKWLYGPQSFSWYGTYGQTIYLVEWRICAGSVCNQWNQGA